MAPTAGAAEPCPTPPLCVETDAKGVYFLSAPPLTLVSAFYPQVKPLEDCLWERVEVDFGDGSPDEIYVWNATQYLNGSHTFQTPGTYTVHINATQGHHLDSGEPCPDFPLTATVTYPKPPPPKTDPPADPPDDPPTVVPTDQGKTVPSLLPVAADTSIASPWNPAAEEPVYWRRCRNMLVHLVTCRKGRRLARAVTSKLDRAGAALVGDFRCRLIPASPWPVVCRRDEQRVLATLPG